MNQSFHISPRKILGALVLDVPPALWLLRPAFLFGSQNNWIKLRNRAEKLIEAEDGIGVQCDWQWTSDVYLAKVIPMFGNMLYKCAFKDFPVALNDAPSDAESGSPQVSVIIGHRGIKRMPHLMATLRSVAGQKDCSVECIVVEQDTEQLVRDKIPSWVRYIHTPIHDEKMGYSRSWAFNEGARHARSNVLVFHDNDMLVPENYAKEMLATMGRGYDVANLKRFVFYLDEESSNGLLESPEAKTRVAFDAIVQNLEGGGSFGITREAFEEIGGFDERFVGWGGEDNEFWERAETRKMYPYGYLPIIHLWHEPQREKHTSGNSGEELYNELSMQDPEERILKLVASHKQ